MVSTVVVHSLWKISEEFGKKKFKGYFFLSKGSQKNCFLTLKRLSLLFGEGYFWSGGHIRLMKCPNFPWRGLVIILPHKCSATVKKIRKVLKSQKRAFKSNWGEKLINKNWDRHPQLTLFMTPVAFPFFIWHWNDEIDWRRSCDKVFDSFFIYIKKVTKTFSFFVMT